VPERKGSGLSRRAALGAATVGVIGASGRGLAAPSATVAAPATFVLVHGAWHGGWCWQRVVDRLAAKGHRVFAPTLTGVCERSHLSSPSVNLSVHISDVVNEIKWKDLDHVVLVGHSYGGMVITGVAEQIGSRIASIVYLDAFIPADGQSLADLGGMAEPRAFTKPIPAIRFSVNKADQGWVDGKMTPQSTACFTEKLQVTGAYQNVAKKTYIRAKNFAGPGAFGGALEKVRKDSSWKTHVVDCGHDVMLDKPDELASLLLASI